MHAGLIAGLALGAAMQVQPHVLFLLVDDLGYANLGFNRPSPSEEVVTPRLDELRAVGLGLERHYVYRMCSPSRSSLQSGRLAVHVNTRNSKPTVYNRITGAAAGIPRNMSTIALKLRAAGYATHLVGKWDAGMATPRHAPLGRGYDSWLGYYNHANDYHTKGVSLLATGTIDICLNRFTDLWDGLSPVNNAHTPGWESAYEEDLFLRRSLDIINRHDPAIPLFLMHSFHMMHVPLQARPASAPRASRSRCTRCRCSPQPCGTRVCPPATASPSDRCPNCTSTASVGSTTARTPRPCGRNTLRCWLTSTWRATPPRLATTPRHRPAIASATRPPRPSARCLRRSAGPE